MFRPRICCFRLFSFLEKAFFCNIGQKGGGRGLKKVFSLFPSNPPSAFKLAFYLHTIFFRPSQKPFMAEFGLPLPLKERAIKQKRQKIIIFFIYIFYKLCHIVLFFLPKFAFKKCKKSNLFLNDLNFSQNVLHRYCSIARSTYS